MLIVLMLLCVEKNVAVGTTRLIFILPEKREDVKLNNEMVDSIYYDSLYVGENPVNEESKDIYVLRVYSNGGFIELKVKENNKEEICKIIKDMMEETWNNRFSKK